MPPLKKLLASGAEHKTSVGMDDFDNKLMVSFVKFIYPLDILMGKLFWIEFSRMDENILGSIVSFKDGYWI